MILSQTCLAENMNHSCKIKITIKTAKCKNLRLEPETSVYKWLFQLDDSKSLYRKWLFKHQFETFIKLVGWGSRSLYPLYMAIILGLMLLDFTTGNLANLPSTSWVQVLCDKCQWPRASPEAGPNWGPKSEKGPF